MKKIKIEKLEKIIPVKEVGSLLRKFFYHLGGSSMVWNEKGELVFVDFITPFCEVVYSKIPQECEKDRKKRFRKALKADKPFLHRCFAGKLNYVIPLKINLKDNLYFLGVAGG